MRLAALGCTALAALAGIAELVAVQAALAEAVAAALALHALSAVLVGACVLATLRYAGRSDAGAALGAWLLALFAPAVGAVTVIAIGLPSFRRSAARGGTRRMAAAEVLRHVESTHAEPLLRRALRDPSDDVRGLAHAILARRERLLRDAIDGLRKAVARLSAQPSDARAQARVHAELAERYWELCHAGFATGDDAVQALREAAVHAEAASAHRTTRGAALMAVRAYLRIGALDEADAAIDRAAHAGLTSAQLAPLRAELAYLTRRFGRLSASPAPSSCQRAPLGDAARLGGARRRA